MVSLLCEIMKQTRAPITCSYKKQTKRRGNGFSPSLDDNLSFYRLPERNWCRGKVLLKGCDGIAMGNQYLYPKARKWQFPSFGDY